MSKNYEQGIEEKKLYRWKGYVFVDSRKNNPAESDFEGWFGKTTVVIQEVPFFETTEVVIYDKKMRLVFGAVSETIDIKESDSFVEIKFRTPIGAKVELTIQYNWED